MSLKKEGRISTVRVGRSVEAADFMAHSVAFVAAAVFMLGKAVEAPVHATLYASWLAPNT